MSDDKNQKYAKPEVEPDEVEVVEAELAADDSQDNDDSQAAVIEELENQVFILQNRWASLKADFENYKRRTRSETETIKKNANEELVLELLPILDNFERALANAPEETSFTKGVQMIFEQLEYCLRKQGLQPIASVGEPFDPRYHEAMSKDDGGDGPFVVKQELQKGYLFQDKVLRASMVHVASEDNSKEDDNNG